MDLNLLFKLTLSNSCQQESGSESVIGFDSRICSKTYSKKTLGSYSASVISGDAIVSGTAKGYFKLELIGFSPGMFLPNEVSSC